MVIGFGDRLRTPWATSLLSASICLLMTLVPFVLSLFWDDYLTSTQGLMTLALRDVIAIVAGLLLLQSRTIKSMNKLDRLSAIGILLACFIYLYWLPEPVLRTNHSVYLQQQLGPVYLLKMLSLSLFQQILMVWVIASIWPDSHRFRLTAGALFALGHLTPLLLGRTPEYVIPVALAAGSAYVFWLFVVQKWKAPVFAWLTHFGFYWSLAMIHRASLG